MIEKKLTPITVPSVEELFFKAHKEAIDAAKELMGKKQYIDFSETKCQIRKICKIIFEDTFNESVVDDIKDYDFENFYNKVKNALIALAEHEVYRNSGQMLLYNKNTGINKVLEIVDRLP